MQLHAFAVMVASFIILVAVVLINTLSCYSAGNVYCITPSSTSCSSCPPNTTHCTTLSKYAQKAERYFVSYATMVFLPGHHVLDTNVTVANVARLTMCGESSSGKIATVVCNGSVGFSFMSMVNFKIYSLHFTSCSRNFDGPPPTRYYALLVQSTPYAELVNCSFHDNHGTALVVKNSNITLAGKSEFTHNQCKSNSCFAGGGIDTHSSNITFTGNTNFLENFATNYQQSSDSGGAIYANNSVLSFSGINNFINNSATRGFSGSAIAATSNSVLTLNGTNNFINNSAPYDGTGGAISIKYNTVLSFNGINQFINNSADAGGAIFTAFNVILSFNGINKFINNSAVQQGGAFYFTVNSTVIFNGTTYFTQNKVDGNPGYGGGVSIVLKSILSILPNTTVYWENNHAVFGGGIYVSDDSPISYCTLLPEFLPFHTYMPKEKCFFQLPGQNLSNIDSKLVFENNSADVAGSVLYGGIVDNCKVTDLDTYNSSKVFDMLVYIDDNTTSSISSRPFRVCPCESNIPKCSEPMYHVPYTVYPGETFHVSVVAVGQRSGIVPTAVRSSAMNIAQYDIAGDVHHSQYIQQVDNTCTKLNYTVFSLSQGMMIGLRADNSHNVESYQCYTGGYELYITVNLAQTCPPGFNISESEKICVCEQRLAKYTQDCNITERLGCITRDSGRQYWVGYDNQSDELILHPLCPFDYCVSEKVVFPLNNTDKQCANHRSGRLCGACKKGYSLVLGTSQCKQCTNDHLTLLIPFALMGLALVFLLLVCKLTVATGTLSGLVFYANIVGVNRTIFLPVESTDALSVFIAWVNLDFGIETCFYNGMDAYSKTWLQFVFPVYILTIVGLLVLVSHFSSRFARLLGNNPVSVLATLILLSYTKILRALITVLYVTYLEYPTYNSMVWLYDASIDFLSGKHIPLFLVAVLVFLFLFLPYTLLLLFGQWLQAMSHLRLFSWVNSARLKPFMDSYHAPYKAKHRYWPGLLLLLRFALFLVFAFQFNPHQNKRSINLLVVLVGAGVLVVWAWVSGGVYRNWHLDALEGTFALNLIILAASTMYINTYHVSPSESDQLVLGYTSVSIAFATFIGILVFHVANVTGIAHYLKMKCTIKNVHQTEAELEPPDVDSLPDRLVNPARYEPPFYTPQRHATAEPTEKEELVNEAQRKLIPAYTYGSVN